MAIYGEAIDFSRYHPVKGLRKIAHETSVDFLRRNASRAVAFGSAKDLLKFGLSKVDPSIGGYAEFGVYEGASINFIADQVRPHIVYGFDSFEGLPTDWHNMPKEFFSLGGKLPKVRSNVKLVKGFFDATLPQFLHTHRENFCFIHIDCDVYISTKAVLDNLADRVVPGTIIQFDDYLNQPFWEEDSHKAFQEIRSSKGWIVEYIGYSYQELLVRVVSTSGGG